jgi:hypothetical protein
MQRSCAGNDPRSRPFRTPTDPGPRSPPQQAGKTRSIRSAPTGGCKTTGHPAVRSSRPIRSNYSCSDFLIKREGDRPTALDLSTVQNKKLRNTMFFHQMFLFKQERLFFVASFSSIRIVLDNPWALDTRNKPKRKSNKVCQADHAPSEGCSPNIRDLIFTADSDSTKACIL